MSTGATLSSLAIGLAEGRDLLRAFGWWWLQELLGLFPRNVAEWLVEDGRRSLVLAPEADAVVLCLTSDRGRLLASTRLGREDYATDRIDAFLRAHRQSRDRIAVGLRLPNELVFSRSFALPLETRRSLDAVVVRDLLAKTPFQLDAIHHAHHARRVGDKLVVTQHVVRRSHVAAAAETLGLAPDEVGFVECSDADDEDGAPRIVTKPSLSARPSRWVQRIALGLIVTAVLLATGVLAARYHRQQATLDTLQAEAAAATAKARSVRTIMEKRRQAQAVLLHLREKRSAPGLLDVWEEATRILPEHTWLSELRLSEEGGDRQVVMTGFSAAAASLIGLLERSSVFAEASLVGPVAVDPKEGRERFVIQATLRRPAPAWMAER